MAQVDQYSTKVELTVSLTLPERQARALKWVVDYGADNFIKFAGDSSEGRRHESAIKELVSELRDGLSITLARADKAREAFKTETPK